MAGKRRPRRLKRTFPKRFSSHMVNAGKYTSPLAMAEYRGRARHLGVGPHEIPPTVLQLPGSALSEVKQRMAELKQSPTLQFTQEYHCICILDTYKIKLWRYFSGNKNFFVILYVETGTKQRSLMYASKEEAMRYYNLGLKKIVWVETRCLPPPTPS